MSHLLKLIDTDIVIDMLRGLPAAEAWIDSLGGQELAVSVVTAMEPVQGARNSAKLRDVGNFLQTLSIYWMTPAIHRLAFDILKRHHLSTARGISNALIAANAMTHDLPLHTFNRKHFGVIPGHTLVQPYDR